MEDLRWLGLEWDEGPDIGGPLGPYRQSERLDLYAASFERLQSQAEVYPCTCTRKELRSIAGAPQGEELAWPIYPGTCRSGPRHPERMPSFRFRMRFAEAFEDGYQGEVEAKREWCEDFVVRRADGQWAYQLAVVVDDAMMGMSEVLRGDDLLSSTPKQIALYHALGWKPPRFYHLPLVVNAHGERLSKRDHALSLASLREQGVQAREVLRVLALSLGLADPPPLRFAEDLLHCDVPSGPISTRVELPG